MAEELEEFIPTRRTLLSRLRNREDQESWKNFFDTYWKLIFRVAVKAGLTQTEAEDVVQETVLSVVQTMPGYKYEPEVCSFKSWLMHLTRKRISDGIRKRPREWRSQNAGREVEDDRAVWDQIPDPNGCELEKVWDEEWHRNLLDTAIRKAKGKANPSQYQIFHLYVVKGLPVREVARALKVNLGQVYLAKHRVSQLVKAELKLLQSRAAASR